VKSEEAAAAKYCQEKFDTDFCVNSLYKGFVEGVKWERNRYENLWNILEKLIESHSEEEKEYPCFITSSGKTYSLNDVLSEMKKESDKGSKMGDVCYLMLVDILTGQIKKNELAQLN
jgi:hypothetical protein